MSATIALGRPGLRLALPLLFLTLVVVFALAAPGFLSQGNLLSLLLNNGLVPALVALGLTYAIAAGGIDLSLGIALDLAAFGCIALLNAGWPLAVALAGGLGLGLLVGVANALLVAGVGLSPFLASLGLLFIGTSLQQLLSEGGLPLYLKPEFRPAASNWLGVPAAVWTVLLLAGVYGLVLARGRLGRALLAVGSQPLVARYSGLALRRLALWTCLATALAAAVAGMLLALRIDAYVPLSGNAYLINGIGAVFIGASLNRHGRPNVPGTLLGVLLLAVAANGLLLVGWNFYWQQVATGLLILLVLTLNQLARRHDASR